MDADSLKNVESLSNVDENVLQQMSEVFKHYQISNNDAEEVCMSKKKSTNACALTNKIIILFLEKKR